MDQDKLEYERRRAAEAQDLLDNPLLQEALETIRASVDKEWLDAPARDTEGRERLWMMRKLTDKFEAHLTSIVNDGKIASKKLADLEKKNPISQLWS